MKNKITILLSVLVFLLFIQINTAQAGCCLQGDSSILCRSVQQGCTDYKQLGCSSYSACDNACCISATECAANIPSLVCTQGGGSSSLDDPSCEGISECDSGCCIYEGNAQIVSRGYCDRLNGDFDKDITSALKCSEKAQEGLGCCTTTCKNTKETECIGNWDSVHKCAQVTACDCKTTESGGAYLDCYGTNVWLFDSCDNPYQLKTQCNFPSTLCNSTTKTCVSNGCTFKGQPKKHGQSWCDYDLRDNKNDSVGARHWLYQCQYGKINMLGCEDAREEICTEKTDSTWGSIARCEQNEYSSCIGKKQGQCTSGSTGKYCKWDTSSSACVPKSRPGYGGCSEGDTTFDINLTKFNLDFGACDTNNKKCGNQRVTVQYKPGNKWETLYEKTDCSCCIDRPGVIGNCVQNTVLPAAARKWTTDTAEGKALMASMQSYCKSLGDCGSSVHFNPKANITSGQSLTMSIPKGKCGDVGFEGMQVQIFGFSFNLFILGTWLFFVLIIFIAFTKKKHSLGIVAIISVLLVSSFLITGCGKCEFESDTITGTFSCYEVQKNPSGEAVCTSCNNDLLKPCSQYRCESLGSDCKWIEESQYCSFEEDFTPPHLTDFNVTRPPVCAGDSVNPDPQSDLMIDCTTSDGCVPPHSLLNINFSTNEPTICKYAYFVEGEETLPLKWEDMNNARLKNPTLYNVSHMISMPPNAIGLSPDPGKTLNITGFLRCQDGSGNTFPADYIMKLCLSTKDETSPVLETSINNNSYFPAGTTSIEIKLYIDEPVDKCKWDKDNTHKEYATMRNTATTPVPSMDIGYEGWYETNITLPLIKDIINHFYFGCNDTKNNTGYTDLVLLPSPPLDIESVSPANGETVPGCEISPVELRVVTANGSEEGVANCSYKNATETLWGMFENTNAVEHMQELYLGAGTHKYNIFCEDSAGNNDSATTTFTVAADTFAPIITRIYRDGDSLVLHTNEAATCAWNDHSCSFSIEDFTKEKFTQGNNDLTHTTSWRTETWYVRCKDRCGNEPPAGSCVTIVPQQLG